MAIRCSKMSIALLLSASIAFAYTFRQENTGNGNAGEAIALPINRTVTCSLNAPVLSSLCLVNDTLFICARDSSVYSIYNGAVIWKFKTRGWVDATPAYYNGSVYAGSRDGLVYVLNAATGDSIDFTSSGYARGGAEYLKLPVHAHSGGLCGAVAAWSDELSGVQYNPAILDVAVTGSFGIVGSYTFKTLDRRHYGVTAGFSIGDYVVADFSFVNHSVLDIEGRDSLGNLMEDFTFFENAITATIAGRLQWPISIGLSLRYLSEGLDDERAHGFGLDFGALYYPTKIFRIGLSGLNIGSDLYWSTGESDEVLKKAQLGIAGLFLDTALVIEADFAKSISQPVDIMFGAQYTILNMIGIRAGISTGFDHYDKTWKIPDFAFGAGFSYNRYGFDYSFFRPSSELGPHHKISVVFNPEESTGKI